MLLRLHPPFLLADGGVLQRAPTPAPALYLTAVCMRAGVLPCPDDLCEFTDAILLSTAGGLLCPDDLCECTDAILLSTPSKPTVS